MKTFVVFCCLVAGCVAYPGFMDAIPNGHNVQNPCAAGGSWSGVGHNKHQGTGPLNAFGQDLKNSGFQWNQRLCLKDSDGDGKTNGEELGDPHCHWTPSSKAHLRRPSGHPGICEPMNTATCLQKNSMIRC